MPTKRLFLMLNLMLFCASVSAQSLVTNRIKLLIFNEKKEMLLVKWKGNWEVPGAAYGDSTVVKPFNAFLDNLAGEFGLKASNKKLAGMFTYYLNDRQYPVIYSYYTARAEEVEIKLSAGTEDARWFSFDEMIKKVAYPNSVEIIKKIVARPARIWGGAFRMYPAKGWSYETVEDFYPMN